MAALLFVAPLPFFFYTHLAGAREKTPTAVGAQTWSSDRQGLKRAKHKERDRDMTDQGHTDHRSGQDVNQRMDGGLSGSRVRQQ